MLDVTLQGVRRATGTLEDAGFPGGRFARVLGFVAGRGAGLPGGRWRERWFLACSWAW
jgi:hypothetical protein